MKRIFTVLLLIIALSAGAQNTKVVAHRGYWDTPDNAQNSITSLVTAQKIPVYGSEFDVNMTSDGVMVVSHGPKLESIPDVQKASYKEVKKVRLKNGEKVPTLKQYLKQGKKGNIKLIFASGNAECIFFISLVYHSIWSSPKPAPCTECPLALDFSLG